MQNKYWSLAGALLVASAILTPHAAMAQTNQTIAFGALLPKEVGDPPFALSATATSALAVAFTTSTPAICSVSGATATALAAGTCTITANQAGNATYSAAPAVSQSFLVNPEDDGFLVGLIAALIPKCTAPTIAQSANGQPLYAGQTVTATVVCTRAPTSYTWRLNGTVIANATSATITTTIPANITSAVFSVVAVSTISSPPVSSTFNVLSAPNQTIGFGTIPPQILSTGSLTIGATATPSSLPVSFSTTTPAFCSVSGTTVSLLAIGTCEIAANQSGNSSYSAAAQVLRSFAINATAQGGVSFTGQPAAVSLGGSIGLNATYGGNSTATSVTYQNIANNAFVGTNCSPGTSCAWIPTASGTYTIRANVTLQNGQVVTSNSTFVVAAQPGANAANAPIPTTTVGVGTSAGTFSVSDSGAATYSMPLQIAPGTAGMQPNLSLNYSSQGGNGQLGVGWSLGGLSAITRCPKTYAQDGDKQGINYDSNFDNDAYCLDGQRLIPVGTSTVDRYIWDCDLADTSKATRPVKAVEYRTEIESYSRILGYNESPLCLGGPTRFEVYTKDGRMLNFGSRYWVVTRGYIQNVQNPDRLNTAYMWLLDQVQDRLGNRMLIDYQGNKIWNASAAELLDTVIFLGPRAPATSVPNAPNSLVAVGGLPALEVWPTQIVYTLNAATGNNNAQAVLFTYADRKNIFGGATIPNGADECGDCAIGFDSGSGQQLLTKYLQKIEARYNGVYSEVVSQASPWPQYSSSLLARSYTLTYSNSPATRRLRLDNVKECASDDVTCLNPTTFSWQGTNLAVTKTAFTPGTSALGPLGFGSSNSTDPRIADIDGDGKSDFIRLIGGTDNVKARIALSSENWVTREVDLMAFNIFDALGHWDIGDFNGDGRTDIAILDGVNNGTAGSGSSWSVFFYNPLTGTPRTSRFDRLTTTTTGAQIRSAGDLKANFRGDFNGDGRIDLAFYDGQVGTVDRWRMYFGAANNTIIGPVYVEYPSIFFGNDILLTDRVVIGDFTGDGRADFAFKANNNDIYNDTAWRMCESSAIPSVPIAGATYTLNCTASNVIATPGKTQRNSVVDMNGDGIADLIAPAFYNTSATCQYGTSGSIPGRPAARCWKVCLSTADGAFSCSDQAGPATTASYTLGDNASMNAAADRALKETVFGDFNGDGRTDYAAKLSDSEWTVCLSRGASIFANAVYGTDSNVVPRFDCQIKTASTVPGSNWPTVTENNSQNEIGRNLFAGDFTAKGRTSILSRLAGDSLQLTEMAGDFPDLMSGYSTGLGAGTSVIYKPLTDATVYTKGTATQTYPNFDIVSPLYVVAETNASTGAPEAFKTTYSYQGLVGAVDTTESNDATGRGHGLLGFAKRTITDGNGIITVVESSQTWPVAGRPTKVTKFASDGTANRKVNEVTNTWETRLSNTYSPAVKKVYETFLTNSVEKSWELNGHDGADATLLHTATTSTAQFNMYGNPLSISASSSDGYSKSTTNTFSEDGTNWVLGRLKTSTVTSTRPDGASTLRKVAFDYFCVDSYACADTKQRGLLAAEYVEKDSLPSEYLSLTTSYTYDAYGNKASSTVAFYEKDSAGNPQPKSRTAQTFWGNEGRFPLNQYNALNHLEQRVFDGRWGAPTRVISPDGLRTEFSYDTFGRKSGEQLFDSGNLLLSQSAWTYFPLTVGGQERYGITMSRHDGTFAVSYFDYLQREVRSTVNTFGGGTATAKTGYDKLGRKIWTSRPVAGAGSSSTTASVVDYDVLNRPITETVLNAGVDPASWLLSRTSSSVFSTSATSYARISAADPAYGAALRNRSKLTVTRSNTAANGGAQTTSRETNSQGQTVRVTDANIKDTWYVYDAIGNLAKVTGPTSIAENMTYDLRGRKKTLSNPDSGNWTYEYNGAGELTKQTDANGSASSMTYDTLGRISSRSETGGIAGVSNSATAWFYDNAGQCGTAQTSRTGKLCGVTSGDGGVTTGAAKTITYDSQARPFQVVTKISNKDFASYTTFDANGRPDLVGYPANETGSNLWVKNEYTTNGFLDKVRDANAANTGTIHWQALSRFDDGQPNQVKIGNVTVTKGYDTIGRIATIAAPSLQNSSYGFDQLGNLVTRADALSGLNETYTHDKLNRINTGPAGTYGYDDSGNLTTKPGTGTLTYLAGSHRLNIAGYSYDNNGNLTAKPGSNGTIGISQYTPFNLPLSITKSGVTVLAYDYDGDRARIKETSTTPGNVNSTIYVGNQFFEEITKNNVKEYRYYIGSPDGVIAVASISGTTRTDKYWLKDHLGSLYGEMNIDGTGLQRVGFDAWGASSNADFTGLQTQRGFTGHEHLTEVGLIHMNGRLYDPVTGRMMQADPIVQDPYNPQNFNRYSYVMNNPLSFTDPTGFSWWTKWRRPILSIAVAWAIGPAGFWSQTGGIMGNAFASTVAGGFAAGGISGGNLNSALQGAFFAAAFFQVGELTGAHSGVAMSGAQRAGQVAGHALIGCAQGAAAGGSCRAGAMSAGFAAAAGPSLPGADISVERFLSRIVVGAIGSKLGGGGYENGAMTAAFGYLFNELGRVNLRGLGSTFLDDTFSPRVDSWAAAASTRGVELNFNSAFRSTEAQAGLATDPNAVTPAPAGGSLHEAGFAVDVNYTSLRDIPGGLSGDQQRNIIRETATQAGISWGGAFRTPDPPHFFVEPSGDRGALIRAAQQRYTQLNGR